MVQRAMGGPEMSIDCLGDQQGRCLNAIPRTMLESRGGESIKGQVIDDEELIELGRRVIEALRVRGPATIQVFRDPDIGLAHHRREHPLRRRLPRSGLRRAGGPQLPGADRARWRPARRSSRTSASSRRDDVHPLLLAARARRAAAADRPRDRARRASAAALRAARGRGSQPREPASRPGGWLIASGRAWVKSAACRRSSASSRRPRSAGRRPTWTTTPPRRPRPDGGSGGPAGAPASHRARTAAPRWSPARTGACSAAPRPRARSSARPGARPADRGRDRGARASEPPRPPWRRSTSTPRPSRDGHPHVAQAPATPPAGDDPDARPGHAAGGDQDAAPESARETAEGPDHRRHPTPPAPTGTSTAGRARTANRRARPRARRRPGSGEGSATQTSPPRSCSTPTPPRPTTPTTTRPAASATRASRSTATRPPPGPRRSTRRPRPAWPRAC